MPSGHCLSAWLTLPLFSMMDTNILYLVLCRIWIGLLDHGDQSQNVKKILYNLYGKLFLDDCYPYYLHKLQLYKK